MVLLSRILKKYSRRLNYLLIICCIISISSYGQAKMTETEQQKRDYYLYLAKTNCSDAYSILISDPNYPFTRFLQDERKDWLENFNWSVYSNIFEKNKVFEKTVPPKNKFDQGIERYRRYFINKSLTIICHLDIKYASMSLNPGIPDSLGMQIRRFKHYHGDTLSYFWYSSWIFGLLNYFDAHYQQCKADAELRIARVLKTEIYNRETITEVPGIGKYRLFEGAASITDLLNLAIEQRLYISWYLRYAKEREPDIYKQVQANTNLRIAYTLLDDQFHNLLKKIDHDTLVVQHYSTQYNQFVSKQDKTELEQFRMKNVNPGNCRNYLVKY